MTRRFARGDKAWGECARSGRRMLLKDMVEDPRTGLLVDPSWAEDPDPLPPANIIDGISLHRPAPSHDREGVEFVYGYAFDLASGESAPPLIALFAMGTPTVIAA